jgi:hypothetical protein
MKTVSCGLEVDTESMHVHGEYVRGKLRLKLGQDYLPAKAEIELVPIVCMALMQAALSVLDEETERTPVVMEGSLAAALIENGGKGRLDIMGFKLSPKGQDSEQVGFWHVDAREFLKALLSGANQITRACITHEWQGEDISVLIHMSIQVKTWLDENKDGGKSHRPEGDVTPL